MASRLLVWVNLAALLLNPVLGSETVEPTSKPKPVDPFQNEKDPSNKNPAKSPEYLKQLLPADFKQLSKTPLLRPESDKLDSCSSELAKVKAPNYKLADGWEHRWTVGAKPDAGEVKEYFELKFQITAKQLARKYGASKLTHRQSANGKDTLRNRKQNHRNYELCKIIDEGQRRVAAQKEHNIGLYPYEKEQLAEWNHGKHARVPNMSKKKDSVSASQPQPEAAAAKRQKTTTQYPRTLSHKASNYFSVHGSLSGSRNSNAG